MDDTETAKRPDIFQHSGNKRRKLEVDESTSTIASKMICVTPDEPETFYSHPIYKSIKVSTLGQFMRDDKLFSIGNNCRIQFTKAEIRSTNSTKTASKLTLIAETYLGPRPSKHHFAKQIDPANGFRLSNIIWHPKGQIVNFNQMSDEEKEQWKPLADPYNQYMYSKITGQIHNNGLILNATTGYEGYPWIKLKDKNGKTKPQYVHIIIATTEYGPRPKGYDVAHLDGNKLNYTPSNLAYQTKSENNQQSAKRFRRGVQVTSSNATSLEFDSVKQAAQYFGIAIGTVYLRCGSRRLFNFKDQKWNFEYVLKKTKSVKQLTPTVCIWDRSECEFAQGYEFTKTSLWRRIDSSFLVSQFMSAGYLSMHINNVKVRVHVAMLQVFKGKRPSPRHLADHIDECKTHNCISNLQWTLTNVERSRGKPCQRLNNEIWETFNSMESAAKQLASEQSAEAGIVPSAKNIASCRSSIRVAMKSSRRRSGGYQWRWLDEGPVQNYTCPDCGKEFTKRSRHC